MPIIMLVCRTTATAGSHATVGYIQWRHAVLHRPRTPSQIEADKL